jgi:hypothetical protein
MTSFIRVSVQVLHSTQFDVQTLFESSSEINVHVAIHVHALCRRKQPRTRRRRFSQELRRILEKFSTLTDQATLPKGTGALRGHKLAIRA